MKYLTTQEAAKICKVTYQTIMNWIKEGVFDNAFKATVVGKSRWQIPYTDLPTFYRRQYEKNKDK